MTGVGLQEIDGTQEPCGDEDRMSKNTANPTDIARSAFRTYCKSIGTAAEVEETAILSVGEEFLPPCALAVLDDRNADSAEYYEWLTSQTREAQDEHDREAGLILALKVSS